MNRNRKLRKGLFWGAIIASTVFVMNLLGGLTALAAGPFGHGNHAGGRGMMHGQGGFGNNSGASFGQGNSIANGQAMMGGHGSHQAHHFLGFGLSGIIFLILAIVAVVLLLKWFRRRSKASNMQLFINTSLATPSHTASHSPRTELLDQWEQSLLNKKERE